MTLEARRIYGFFLASTHLVTLIFWKAFDFNFGLLDKLTHLHGNNWSWLPQSYPDFIQANAAIFFWSYFVLALISPLPFLISKISFKTANIIFTMTFLLKVMISFSTYDFMGNYQYMNNLVMTGFILTAGNLFIAQMMIILFYFGAGLIKLNWEWISGAALLRDTFISGPLLIAACIYVIVLELVLAWGVFSRTRWIRHASLFQLLCFHLFSWHIVGYYYPVIMILLLTVFVIYERPPGRPPRWAYVYIAFFFGAQLYPKILNKEESLTAEGRTLALNMLDAKTHCLGSYEIKKDDGFIYLDQPVNLSIRVRCDPLVFYNYGKYLCAQLDKSQRSSMILNLKARKTTDEKMVWTVRNQKICDDNLTYSIWLNNWVHANNNDLANDFPRSSLDVTIQHWRENPARTGETTASIPLTAIGESINLPLHSGIHSAAKSSPVVVGNEWFVGTDNGFLWGFKNTKKIWSSYFPEPNYGFHGSAATTADGYILIGSYDGVLHKIDAHTGKRIWAEKLGMAVGSSPLIIQNQVFVSVEDLKHQSHFYSLDFTTGNTIWKISYDGLSHASLAYDKNTDTLFGATNTGLLVALNRASGRELWKKNLEGKIIASPLVANNLVFAISTAGVLSAYDTKDGKMRWQSTLPSGSRASPTYSSDSNILIVPLESGTIKGFSATDGKEIWSYSNPHLHVSSGLLASHIYWDQCAEKKLCAFEDRTGKILKEFKLPGNFSSTPAVLGNSILITLDGDQGFWILGNPTMKP